jgi:nucleotide-binding universal stress UspA family protein
MAFKHIIVATDLDECSQPAIEVGIELAREFNAELTLVHAWEFPTYPYGAILHLHDDLANAIQEAAQRELDVACAALKARLPGATAVLREGEAWREILAAAESAHADLIVVGTHGRRGLGRALLGSVAERVVRLATVPVLTVHSEPAQNAT